MTEETVNQSVENQSAEVPVTEENNSESVESSAASDLPEIEPIDTDDVLLSSVVAKALYIAFVKAVGEPAQSWEALEKDATKIPAVRGWYAVADEVIFQLGEK